MADEQEPQLPSTEDAAAAAALLFPGDGVIQAIMAQVHKPTEMRIDEAREWLDVKPS